MSGLFVDSIKDASNTKTLATLSSSSVSLHSDVVFPAGHVIQTNYYTYSAANSGAISSDTPTIFTQTGTSNQLYKATISGLTSGNDVLVVMTFPIYIYKAGSTAGCTFHIFRDSDSTPVYGNVSSGNKRAQFNYVEIPNSDRDVSELVSASVITLVYMDESPSSTSHTYYAGASTDSSSAIYLYSNNALQFTSIIQEIQR
tara:strand:+ start:647 stop:1246 length:600 start_codon:yes stop_codon:yes gene_type:complete